MFILFIFPLLLALVGAFLLVSGTIQFFNASAEKKRKGKIKLLIGLIILCVLIAILNYVGNNFSRA
jgi:uncharacterized membrane protein HdeD (DUF308 family)